MENHRGRLRLQCISQIIEDHGCNSYQELKRNLVTENHESCCKQIIRLYTVKEEYTYIILYIEHK